MFDREFYKNKRVIVTGHTGFKGSWLCTILKELGADVTGYALEMNTEESLFQIASVEKGMQSYIRDIREFSALKRVFDESKAEIVFHLAAQPLVRESYKDPVYTYQTNVMGTVNLLECVRNCPSVKSVLNVTTDKVYENKEWEWGYRETDPLDGYDIYSNSKSCSELVTHSYKKCYFTDSSVAVSTARAGNVIGGGDFAKDRIIPDCIRSVTANKEIKVRNPYSIRPYQHVLEPLFGYLTIAAEQYKNNKLAGYYNIGPKDEDCITTGELVQLFTSKWGEGAEWSSEPVKGPHEASFLKLDSSRMKQVFHWKPHWNIDTAVERTVEWTKCWLEKGNVEECMIGQIHRYLEK